jgi:hypothetical protein
MSLFLNLDSPVLGRAYVRQHSEPIYAGDIASVAGTIMDYRVSDYLI